MVKRRGLDTCLVLNSKPCGQWCCWLTVGKGAVSLASSHDGTQAGRKDDTKITAVSNRGGE